MAKQRAASSATPGDRLLITGVRIQDFRALRDLCIDLRPLTVLVGENNVGKSSFLQALAVAIGGTRSSEDDLHLSADGVRAPRFIVDVRVSPFDGEQFDDAIRARLGAAIQLPATGAEFFTVRTTGEPSPDGSGVTFGRRFLGGWACDREEAIELPVLPTPVRREHLDLLAFFLLDARRDLVEELRNRTSHWGRLVADVGIDEEVRLKVEGELRELGDQITSASSVLASVREELQRVKEALGPTVSDVTIAPLPGRVAELARAIDVVVGAPNSAALPMRFQGMGARSVAAVMAFHAFTQMRLGVTQDILPLSVAAFEEPEAHLHPQAQWAMFHLISSLPGQKIISTHSPHVARVADLFDLRVFRRVGSAVSSASVPAETNGAPTFSPNALLKIRRFVQRNNGEVLFARVVVLFEGETEDGALPTFARAYWGVDASSVGISLVRVDGAPNYRHFVPVLEALKIPWLIFADGDGGGRDGVENAGKALDRLLGPASPEVVMLPTGADFEQYLVDEGFRAAIEASIAEQFGVGALEGYMKHAQGQPYKNGSLRDYASPGGPERLVRDFCRGEKGVSGTGIAEAIVSLADLAVLPAKVRELFDRVDKILKGSP